MLKHEGTDAWMTIAAAALLIVVVFLGENL